MTDLAIRSWVYAQGKKKIKIWNIANKAIVLAAGTGYGQVDVDLFDNKSASIGFGNIQRKFERAGFSLVKADIISAYSPDGIKNALGMGIYYNIGIPTLTHLFGPDDYEGVKWPNQLTIDDVVLDKADYANTEKFSPEDQRQAAKDRIEEKKRAARAAEAERLEAEKAKERALENFYEGNPLVGMF